jgi:hypothetical protein
MGIEQSPSSSTLPPLTTQNWLPLPPQTVVVGSQYTL